MALKNKRGQGIVEFAIILPLLVFLLVGFIYMALILHDYMALGEATREAARYAAVSKPEIEIRKEIDIGLIGFYNCNIQEEADFAIQDSTIDSLPQNQQLGDYVQVTATMRLDESQSVLLMRAFMPDEITTTLTMRKE